MTTAVSASVTRCRTVPPCWSATAASVEAGKVLGTWDPHTRPIITEYAGQMRFENVEEGVTVAKQIDEVTGLSTLVVIDPKRRAPREQGCAAAGQAARREGRGGQAAGHRDPVNITFQVGSIITVKNGQDVGVGEVLARIPQESSKTRDITGGLPRVAELFEARSPKDAGMLAEIDRHRVVRQGHQGQAASDHHRSGWHRARVPDSQGQARHGARWAGGQQGRNHRRRPADPHDILRLQGVEALARYITDEVQDVYRLQGVKINDKHIEVIVRQMLRRVQIMDAGDTRFIPGEQVERAELLEENERAEPDGKRPATFENVLLGITKARLSTDSFISAASFQETTRVLTEAAIMGKRDDLRGLKENVIVGRLIPAGTGLRLSHRPQPGRTDRSGGWRRSWRRRRLRVVRSRKRTAANRSGG